MAATTTTPTVDADFKPFAVAVATRFAELSEGELYVTAAGPTLFDAYLAAFPPGANPVYRVRPYYDCQTCRQFVRRLGAVVAIKGGAVATVWGGLALPAPFAAVAAALDAAVRAAPVQSVFRTKERAYGASHNYDPKTGERHDHFHGDVADRHWTADPGAKREERDAAYRVLRRGLLEVREADLAAVLDLIAANGLYRGAEHKPAVEGFLALMRAFKAAPDGDLFAWEHAGDRGALFRNTVIGTLLTDLAGGKDFDQAVRAFETKVAPANYKRPTAAITQGMVDAALKTINELDLGGAVARRYAKLADVSVADVLFVDNAARGKMKNGIAAALAGSVKAPAPNLDRATPIAADEFVATVLPGAKTLSVYVENRHTSKFVSLTGGDGPERMFPWDNNFAWVYDGDMADSVKERVKAAGGNVTAKLRVSLSWFNTDDLDLHAVTPGGQHIAFNNKCGILDVDMNVRGETRTPVENLAFNTLADGTYRVFVNQYRRRETADVGFAIEVEHGGQLYQHRYAQALKDGENVECFKLHVKGGALERVETALPGGTASQEKWGVKTQTLVSAELVCYSPNHWGSNRTGARHLIFALEGCRNPGPCRGFFNEYLRPDLQAHRKVFEVLAGKTKCPYAEEQVSGVGFTAARGDSVTVVVDGKRAYTLTF